MYKGILILLGLLFTFQVIGQTPPFIKIGSEQFANTDIYNIHYNDENDVIYVGTNNGFYAYKQNKFIQFQAPKSKLGNSFFAIKQDLKGDVYCCNLGGQIFKVKNNKLELFYQLDQDLVGRTISYYFNSNNEVIVIGLFAIHIVDQSGKLIKNLIPKTKTSNKYSVNVSAQLGNLDVVCIGSASNSSDSVIYRIIKNDGKIKDAFLPAFSTDYSLLFPLKKDLYFRDPQGSIYNFKTGQLSIQASPRERIDALNDSIAIGLGDSEKGFIYQLEKGQLKSTHTIFPNQFLSCAHMNKSGTLFLGTFGEGVYIVPKFESVLLELPDELLLDLKSTEDNEVFLSARSGNFFRVNNDSVKFFRKSMLNKDHIFLKDGTIFPIFSRHKLDSAKKVYSGNIKDQKFINDSIFLCANGSTVSVFNKSFNDLLPKGLAHKGGMLTNFTGRFKAVEFDTNDSSIYISGESEVYKRDWGRFRFDTLKYNNKVFYTNDLEYHNGDVLCATMSDGVLFYQKGIYKECLDELNGLLSNDVYQIQVKHGLLFILTDKGIQVYSFNQKKFLGLGFIDGLIDKNIARFNVSSDKLWIMSKHTLYPILLKDIFEKDVVQNLYLDSIIVNGVNMPYDELHSFSFDENHFKFYFDYRDVETKEEVKIAYNFLGFYKDWKYLPSSTNELEFQSLPPGDYIFQIRAVYRNQKGPVYDYYFEILPPIWQRWWFYILMISVVAFALIFYYRIRLHRQDRIALIEHEMNTSKLTAIQSQMNPHFIFNALNSIQALVLKGDIDNSYAYINKFSSLVRQTLNYSDKEFIELDEEINLIEIYLSLEKLRFREDFEYEINCDLNQDILVPPMLIQPFIENSLVHGLIHKEGLKKIKLTFSFDEVLTCVIEDNGIGRAASKKIKERQNPEHESFAVDAIKNRLDILSERFENRIGFQYDDLTENGVPSGTRVVIHIPTDQNDFCD
jgi:ligand-binding sensor domain-containing protein